MKIYTYAVCWNEELRLPWYLDNYSFADHHFIYDQHSTDGTLKLLKGNKKVTVRPFGKPNVLENHNYQVIKDNCWKRCGADWVIIGDIDELLYHPNMREMLQHTKEHLDVTVLMPSAAYDMFHTEPVTDYKQITKGVFSPGYMKMCCFRPDQITDINYNPGCHKAGPKGNVMIGPCEGLIMYHYNLVGIDYVIKRYAACDKRRSPIDKKNRWAIQYSYPPEKIRERFRQCELHGKVVREW